jgi:hypothetical protein
MGQHVALYPPVVKFFMCCIKYCMWYLEKVLKFINRNAYILVAVKGYSYCYSAGLGTLNQVDP